VLTTTLAFLGRQTSNDWRHALGTARRNTAASKTVAVIGPTIGPSPITNMQILYAMQLRIGTLALLLNKG